MDVKSLGFFYKCSNMENQNFNSKPNYANTSIVQNFNKQIQMFHQNCQIATNKVDELNLLYEEIKPDIFAIPENGFFKKQH